MEYDILQKDCEYVLNQEKEEEYFWDSYITEYLEDNQDGNNIRDFFTTNLN